MDLKEEEFMSKSHHLVWWPQLRLSLQLQIYICKYICRFINICRYIYRFRYIFKYIWRFWYICSNSLNSCTFHVCTTPYDELVFIQELIKQTWDRSVQSCYLWNIFLGKQATYRNWGNCGRIKDVAILKCLLYISISLNFETDIVRHSFCLKWHSFGWDAPPASDFCLKWHSFGYDAPPASDMMCEIWVMRASPAVAQGVAPVGGCREKWWSLAPCLQQMQFLISTTKQMLFIKSWEELCADIQSSE